MQQALPGKLVHRLVLINSLSSYLMGSLTFSVQLIKRDFELAFDAGIDAILTPATPSSAFGLGEMASADPGEMYLNDVFTVTVNLAGLPGVSVPVGLDAKGLPLGLQLIGRPWDEAGLLNHAYVLEQAAGFVAKPAKWW